MKVGIIGAGQLGRMLAVAGYPLGLQCTLLDPNVDACGTQVADSIQADFDAQPALQSLAQSVDVLTFEFENVAVKAMEPIAALKPFYPPITALAAAQDRLAEKTLFRALKIPVAPFAAVERRAELQQAVATIGLPGVLKTRRLGYDGRGQRVLRQPQDIDSAWTQLGGVPLIYEAFVPFSREVSIIGVRSARGEVLCYPLTANTHREGILHYSTAPFRHRTLQQQAERIIKKVLRHFNYVGVLTLEFFVMRGRLVVNEMAPRVHNSGHWTIEGAETSQFENHLRAILGWPLGSTAARGHSAMLNFVGTLPSQDKVLKYAHVHMHHYGKAPRPHRKLGHCTLVTASAAARDRGLKQLLRNL